MKKLPALFFSAIACITVACSCLHHNGNIDISYKDSGEYYSMDAYFSKEKTRDVEKYMDERIGRRSHLSFVNSRIDGTIALNDHTIFYMKKYPGRLTINLDKDENSNESYHQIKSMCQGIKNVVTH